ncbi:protein adenylyltransferase Fic [Acinetobacter boissieri]|uniref:Protein adenylyltransferase n=1 Tax=Acinetobacter boissieri TaxID=1219383 RepID=A0A1G6HDP1_9GAMM|nr:Fic family protein [Acinetobacter boissieri]SDB92380.1 Fic family protein [Acinetobacter boissieri]
MNQWQAEQPYNQLPQLPPEQDVETKVVLKACITANKALAELKQAGELIPNQNMLINIIPLLEAKDSSEIENIVTTTDKLFQHAQGNDDTADHSTKEALRYRTALYKGVQSIKERPLSTGTAIEICQTLKGVDLGIRSTTGTALKNSYTGEVIYTPPVGEDNIRGLLSNWEKFIHYNDDLDPLVKLAVSHYQFEAIHPFIDGNGRTGRVLNVLYLMGENLLSLPILYLSRFIIQNKAKYYELLLNVTKDGDWQSWILFILQAIKVTSEWTLAKINGIKQLHEHTVEYVKANAEKIYTRELVDLIFEQPYSRISNVVEKGIAKRQSASNYLKKLTEIGVLEEMTVGKEKLFIHPKLLALLQDDSHGFMPYE